MWYSGENDQYDDNIGLAISTDGVSWVRYGQNPVLRVGAIGEWDSRSVMEPWVIFENGEYKMWYSGMMAANRTLLSYEIGYATSSDGIHWVKYPANPVLTASPSGDCRRTKSIHAVVRAGNRAHSSDTCRCCSSNNGKESTTKERCS